MIRLLIADDHAIVREGLKQIFSLFDNVEVAGEAANGEQVMSALRKNAFDLILLDMTMPGISGLDLIARIRLHHAQLPVLILSMHSDPQIVRRALKAGASGYLPKDTLAETLIAAIGKIAAGGRYIDPLLAERIAFDVMDSSYLNAPHAHLSDREFQILRLLVSGKSINEIADELVISNKTVSTHKMHLMKKMNFKSNADLVSYGYLHNLFD